MPSGNTDNIDLLPDEYRRLACIMFTDIVGYTSLAERNELIALRTLDRYYETLRLFFKKFGGREIKTIGDAFLVEFESSVNAVRCAMAIQSELSGESGIRSAQFIPIRIGIHVGEVVHRSGDILGDAVNVSSRIVRLAHPGGICVSNQVYENVVNKLDYDFKSMGSFNLKNVSRPMELYSVVIRGSTSRRQEGQQSSVRPSSENPSKNRLVVLPFASFSPDPNDEYFAGGMTEELITRLSQVSGLRVIARTSAAKYKGTSKSASEISSELKIGSLLEGSVRKVSNKVRVSVQLVDGLTEEHLWATNYDRDLSDIFAMQSEIAERVAESLEVKLLAKDLNILRTEQTASISAYIYYLRGRHLMSTASEQGVKDAKTQFELAIEKDPNFPRAYASLGDSIALAGTLQFTPAIEAYRKAMPIVKKALELDNNLSDAHSALGYLLENLEFDWAGAGQEYRTAIELNRSNSKAHMRLALWLASMGRKDEMLDEAKLALDLDPLSASTVASTGIQFYLAEKFEEALELEKQALELSPQHFNAEFWLCSTLLELGRSEEAITRGRQMLDSGRDIQQSIVLLAHAYTRTGNRKEAEEMRGRLHKLASTTAVPASDYTYLYAVLGDNDNFYDQIQKALETHEVDPYIIRLSRTHYAIRQDPRYFDLLRKMNLVGKNEN